MEGILMEGSLIKTVFTKDEMFILQARPDGEILVT